MMTTCDWCLQEARVQTIEEKLWRFWILISTEDPIMTSHRNICDKCKSHYEGFSIYIESCKINRSKIEKLLSTGQVKDEPSIDIEYPPLIQTEISNEVDSKFHSPAVSSRVFIERQMLAVCSNDHTKSNDSTINKVLSTGKIKKKPFIDIEDRLVNEENIWNEEASDTDYLTATTGNRKAELVFERQVLPDSMILQKKVNNNCTCTYCGKTFIYPSWLRIHLRTHTDDKPFKCSHCNKTFTRSSELNRHLRTHTGERPYKCSHCNVSFTQWSPLNFHLRTHTGEKPFKCSYCDKSFTVSSNLNAHLRIHTDEKPFKCSHCNKKFTRSTGLKRHSRVHTNDK